MIMRGLSMDRRNFLKVAGAAPAVIAGSSSTAFAEGTSPFIDVDFEGGFSLRLIGVGILGFLKYQFF